MIQPADAEPTDAEQTSAEPTAPEASSALAEATRIEVAGPHGDILVGRGLIAGLDEVLPTLLGDTARQLLIIHAPSLAQVAEQLRQSLSGLFDRVLLAEVPDAEDAKRVEVAAFCWKVLGQADFTRSDAILGLGGGATTDLAGWVAATWLRGVRVVQVPTTVLGMADAAVGGKTGINTAEGKNLVGSFHPPAGVVCDLDVLESLPRNELVAGFAEVVKAGFIAEPEILDIVEADPERAIDPTSDELRRCLELAIRVKARVVGEDLTEQGLREILNYGHTLGHAIEHAERYQWRHGAAVSIGMVFAAELARMSGRLDDATADRHRAILETLRLPTSYPANRWKTLLATMRRDKKARGAMLRFVVLDGLAKPTIMQAPDESLLFAAYQELGGEREPSA
ncbi:3-dehydroquinate synthase [Pseudoclavibacter triregionum]|nr:3-dehydroquinate synthase [Pseudoclavibacter triregionum]